MMECVMECDGGECMGIIPNVSARANYTVR